MIWIYVAATVIVLIGFMHSYLGETRIFPRLFRADLSPFMRAIVRWAWHLTGVAWLGFAWQLYTIAAGRPLGPIEVTRIIATVFGLTGIVSFVASRGRHIAWPFLAIVAVACWFGVR
jgi:hypothetical protein